MDKVSIIIPTYKRTNELKRAIDSAIKQTYKNIEIIVIDDNAKNIEIRKQVEEIMKNYPTVKYIQNKENLGGALTRNVGIQTATGKFVSFLDDDDEFYEEKVEKQVNLYKKLDNKNCCMIYCYANRITSNKKIVGIEHKDFEGKQLYNHMMGGIAVTSSWLCPKDKLLEVGGFDDVPCQQEGTLLLKLLAKNYEVYRVPEVLFLFYVHNKLDGSGITNINEKYINGKLNYIEKCRKNYDKLNQRQRINVEYHFSVELFNLYCYTKDRKNMLIYLKKQLKQKPINKETIKSIIKFIFLKSYIKRSVNK
ncbi:MAG: glycosyltransferase family 2 protein [Bacilli bacterium]|nr:glycosyltransferase family 2 protein [Bacilli bacterium]